MKTYTGAEALRALVDGKILKKVDKDILFKIVDDMLFYKEKHTLFRDNDGFAYSNTTSVNSILASTFTEHIKQPIEQEEMKSLQEQIAFKNALIDFQHEILKKQANLITPLIDKLTALTASASEGSGEE